MPASKPNLSLPEVAERLCCSVDRVRALIAAGELVAIKTSVSPTSRKPRHVVALVELLAFEERRRTEPARPPTRRRKAAEPEYREYQWPDKN